jgi:tRNA(Ile)-lysidine synthase
MSKYIVAVSGGVDSVVLLHMLQKLDTHNLIVAHVDHGIREESAEDAGFVKALADKYGLPFELSTHALGPDASEERARHVRYEFLRSLSDRHSAEIVTAHHANDIVESIAINLHRGTGWRGLATHDSEIVRPLAGIPKEKLYAYALMHGLEWQEDRTNQSDKYLRNRLRKQLHGAPEKLRDDLLALRKRQIATKQHIATELRRIVGTGPHYNRYFFTHIPKVVALECLREVTNGQLTRPQLEKLLLAVKTIGAGKTLEVGNHVTVHFTTRIFSLSLIK